MNIEAGMKRKPCRICFAVVWIVLMAVSFYFCTQKQGFHEDEYYTYYSTARTNGFYVEDGQWMSAETYRNEFVVLPGERFQYGLIKLVQSWDVHPPLYYWVFHTTASMTPGVFSKWIGLTVNLFFHGINLVLLACLSYLAGGRNRTTALIVTLFYGLTPAAVSGVVFIRMYEMLTMWVLLCGVLHVREVGRWKAASAGTAEAGNGTAGQGSTVNLSLMGFLLPLAATTYLGFLTQYYYFIFLFYMAAGFCICLLYRDRNLWNCLRYGVSQAIAFALAWLTYPSCLGQMFRGQRGAQATENFLELSNTLERFRFFCDLLDEYVFGNLLAWILLLAAIAAAVVYVVGRRRITGAAPLRTKRTPDAALWLLGFAVAGYFLTVSKTALLLGDTSNRYQLPVYGMIVLLLVVGLSRLDKGYAYAAVGLALILNIIGLAQGKVVFLYPEDEEQVAFAAERAGTGALAVYVYQPGSEWCIWDVTNELLEYPAVYFVSADSGDLVEDDRIASAQELVVYLADGVDAGWQLYRITGNSAYLTEAESPVFEEKYCDVYDIR